MATAKTADAEATAVGATQRGAARIAAIDLGNRVNAAELRKPLYASVGAGDLAVEKLRGAPTIYNRRVKDLRGSVREIPQQVRGSINDLQGKATSLYGELAQRGERLVSNIRNTPGTPDGAGTSAAEGGADTGTAPTASASGTTARRSARTRRAPKPVETAAGSAAAAAD